MVKIFSLAPARLMEKTHKHNWPLCCVAGWRNTTEEVGYVRHHLFHALCLPANFCHHGNAGQRLPPGHLHHCCYHYRAFHWQTHPLRFASAPFVPSSSFFCLFFFFFCLLFFHDIVSTARNGWWRSRERGTGRLSHREKEKQLLSVWGGKGGVGSLEVTAWPATTSPVWRWPPLLPVPCCPADIVFHLPPLVSFHSFIFLFFFTAKFLFIGSVQWLK